MNHCYFKVQEVKNDFTFGYACGLLYKSKSEEYTAIYPFRFLWYIK